MACSESANTVGQSCSVSPPSQGSTGTHLVDPAPVLLDLGSGIGGQSKTDLLQAKRAERPALLVLLLRLRLRLRLLFLPLLPPLLTLRLALLLHPLRLGQRQSTF